MISRKWVCAVLAGCLAAIALAEPPPLSAYGKLPGMDDPVLSPSGKRLAFMATIEDRRMLLVTEVGGAPLLKEDVGVKVRNLAWAGEDLVLLTGSATQNLGPDYGGYRHEFGNVLVLDVAHRTGHWLLSEHSRKVLPAAFGDYGYRLHDGRWFGYFGTVPMSSDLKSNSTWISSFELQLSRIDLLTGEMKQVAPARKNGNGWLVDAQGQILASSRYDDYKRTWTLFAGPNFNTQIATYADRFGHNDILGQGRTPGTVFYVMHDADDAAHYMEASLAGNSAPVELLDDTSAADFVFHPRTELLMGLVKEASQPELMLFDDTLQARVRGTRRAFPNSFVRFQSWNEDLTRFVVFTDGHDDPGTWWLVDITTGKAEELGWLYMIPRSQIGPYRLVSYHAADGLEQEGVLTLPPAREPKNLPLVVLPHGGPQARDYPTFHWWAQAFASRGYAVWQPNFRGSAGYGIGFRNAGFGEWGRKMQTDISDGVAELARQGLVDPGRACIVGASYGGYAALAGATVQQGLYRCAVSVAGVADLKDMLVYDDSRNGLDVSRYWRAYMGVTGSGFGSLDSISPARLAQRADAPVLLIHGKDDTVVPIAQSKTMHRALRAAHKPVELIELPGEDHYLSRERTRIAMLESSVAFVLKHNPPGPQLK